MADSDLIHDFWFGTEPDDARVAEQQGRLWWSKDPGIDQQMRERFGPEAESAARGELDGWAATPRTALSLILLTDQFPRNIHRDTPRAFQSDAIALAVCLAGLEQGSDMALRPIERVFFRMPLEHSESLAHQDLSVRLSRELYGSVPAAWQAAFEGFLDFAVRHREIIARFGRFPHRNAILGRSSTPEELAFLRQPGSSF
ncbi:MAG: DUF924 family protein [Noviherbaspirillum sp.]